MRARNYFTAAIVLTAGILFTQCKGKPGEIREVQPGATSDLTPMATEASRAGAYANMLALQEACLMGDMDNVVQLVKRGVDINVADSAGRTALMFSAFNGHAEIVRLLLDSGAGIEPLDSTGRTALIYASTGPFPETVELLLRRKASVNIADNDEHFTALMYAAAEGHLDVVKILMDHGADPGMVDVDGDNAEAFASQGGHTAVVEFLKSR